jgi:tetratricopeptide (TPR) repeat protein
MRKTLWVVLVFVLCLPMIFVGWLVLASRSAWMDASTMKMPNSWRELVADGVLQKAGYGKTGRPNLLRVVRLDPRNAAAWGRLCSGQIDTTPAKESIATCKTAISLDDSEDNWDSLGNAQEASGDPCAAEESYTKAAGKAASSGGYSYVEDMGRAALRCGTYYNARAGLETAIELQEKDIRNTKDWDEEDIAEFKADQQLDREYLVVTFDHLHETKLMKDTCSLAHPDWAGCACRLDDKGKVSCTEAH